MLRRFAAIQALALAAVTGIVMSASATAANVALFADTTFIDYSPPSTSSEGYNMQVALAGMGHTVTTFTGTTAAEWSAALAGQQILVIPEQENGEIAGALPPATITVIQNFVNGGGNLIIASDYQSTLLLNAVFGYTLVLDGSGAISNITGAAAGTAFAGGPASLADNNATSGGVNTASLPGAGVCAYDVGTECMVFQIAQGSGTIESLAYDYFNAAPNGTQDGGWLEALRLASGGTGGGPGGPALHPVPVMPMSGLVLLGLMLAATAAFTLRRSAKR